MPYWTATRQPSLNPTESVSPTHGNNDRFFSWKPDEVLGWFLGNMLHENLSSDARIPLHITGCSYETRDQLWKRRFTSPISTPGSRSRNVSRTAHTIFLSLAAHLAGFIGCKCTTALTAQWNVFLTSLLQLPCDNRNRLLPPVFTHTRNFGHCLVDRRLSLNPYWMNKPKYRIPCTDRNMDIALLHSTKQYGCSQTVFSQGRHSSEMGSSTSSNDL